jgi:hypothetical protein
MCQALKGGAAIRCGIDHPEYSQEVEVSAEVRDSLSEDIEAT